MSGIAGAYQLDQAPLTDGVLAAMVQRIQHRGSERPVIWQSGAIGFGHNPLHTTTYWAAQPHWNTSQTHLITADVRLDNRDQILGTFKIQPDSAPTLSDSQLILMAYAHWGDRCVEYLKGDFAFAIWDQPQQQLFCARDRFGVKPFYYAYIPQVVFGFASEIKALWAIPGLPYQLNETRVGDYLISEFEDPQITFYQDVFRLPAAHTLTVRHRQVQVQSYWSWNPDHEIVLDSDQAYAEQFRAYFLQAVQRRLHGSVSVGSMLSGGLDSSAIACAARILREGQSDALPTFSATFPTVKTCDENTYIQAALALGGFQPFYLEADRYSPLTADFAAFLNHWDEPHYAFNLFLNWNLFAIAQAQNVRVILDGFDGDSTVSHGTRYLPELARSGQWLTLAQELNGFCRNFQLNYRSTLWQYYKTYGLKPQLQRIPFLCQTYRRVRSQLQPQNANSTADVPPWAAGLNPDFVQRIGLVERRERLRQFWNNAQHSAKADHHYRLARNLMPFTLEILDKAAAYFGIELRFPFWDQDLVEFCLALPTTQKIHHGWTRIVLRRAMTDILPPEIQWRPDKANLSPGFEYTFAHFERSRLADTLNQMSDRVAAYINVEAWRKSQAQFLSGSSAPPEALMVTWRSFNLAQWLYHTGL